MKNNKSLIITVALCMFFSGITTVAVNLIMYPRNLSNLLDISDENIAGGSFLAADEYTFNAKDYGVVGDGITDDTAALQALIDMVSNSGGGTINLPRGTYKIDGITLKAYVRLVGEGGQNFSTTIKNYSKKPAITMHTYTQLEHLSVYGNGTKRYGEDATSGTGILLDGSHGDSCQNVLINDVRIQYHGGHGIDFYGGVWIIDIVNSVINSNKLTGIRIDCTNGMMNSGQKNAINIDKCGIAYNGQDGLYLSGTVINVRDCRIENNKLAGISFDYTKAVDTKQKILAYRVNIDGNYSEGHSLAFVYGKLGHYAEGYYHGIYWLSIANNYSAANNKPGVIFINDGIDNYGLGHLYYSNNMFNPYGDIYADFGNLPKDDSIILEDEKRIKNIGKARVQ